jgi:hypothetical protein
MLNKIIRTLFSAAAFAWVVLFVYAEILAECIPLPPVNASFVGSSWSLELIQAGTPITVNNTKVYEWKYKLIGPTGWNQLVTLGPVCCPSLDFSLPDGGGMVYSPPGTGDPTTGFGSYIYGEQTIRIAPDSSNLFTFYTNRLTEARDTVWQLKAGKSLYYVKIAGPSCTTATPYVPNIQTLIFERGPYFYKIVWDEASNACAGTVYWGPAYIGPWTEIPYEGQDVIVNPTTGDTPKMVECGSLEGNQKCSRCIFTTEGSPTCTTIYLNNRPYTKCY